MGLSSLGVGSGLDANALVQSLMKVQQVPLNSLNSKKTDLNSKLTAYAQVKANLTQFQSALADLSKPENYQNYAIASNDSTSVSSTLKGKPVPGMYNVEVNQLAQGQKIISAGIASPTDPIGTGTINISFGSIKLGATGTLGNDGKYQNASFTNNGSPTKSITIDANNNSLAGIRNAINAAAIGVTASIVNDGSATPYRIVLTNTQTGETQSMKISVSNEAANSTSLSSLMNYDAGSNSQTFTQIRKAQDAQIKVDGVAITKPSNTITDAIEGVSLTLNKVNSGNPSGIYVTKDTSGVQTKLQSFVEKYNSLISFLDTQTKYDTTSKTGAVLFGESSIRSIKLQMRTLLSATLPTTVGAYRALNPLGITFLKDGTLSIDSKRLQTALDQHPDDITNLFAPFASATDPLVVYDSAATATKAGTYAVNVSQLAAKASLSGNAAAGLTITAGSNDTLTVNLNGVSQTLTLAAGTYASADALATEIQSKINGNSGFVNLGFGVSVTASAGVLNISSNLYGSNSKVDLSGNAAANLLGLPGRITAGTATAYGTLSGNSPAGLIITSGVNDSFTLNLNGMSKTISLTAKTYTNLAALATEVQTQINANTDYVAQNYSVTVTGNSDGTLSIVSGLLSSNSAVSLTGSAASTLLGSNVGLATAGANLVGTINGKAAFSVGQNLIGYTGDDSEGLKLKITGGSTGSRGTVTYSLGIANALNQALDNASSSGGILTTRTDGINTSIKKLNDNITKMNDKLTKMQTYYENQFSSLDTTMSQLNGKSSSLAAQLTALENNMAPKKN